jgi:hypothetical protein
MEFNELRKLAIDAGFNQRDAETAAAIALAESGGNPTSHNSTPPDDSYGLWQINMLGSMGPARLKMFGLTKNDQLFDPKTNAKAAFKIFVAAGNRFTPWTTYTSGKYKQHLADGSAPVQAVKAANNAVTAVPDAINAFGQTVFKALNNISGVLIGVVLLVLGIVLLLHKQIGGVVSAARKVKKIV